MSSINTRSFPRLLLLSSNKTTLLLLCQLPVCFDKPQLTVAVAFGDAGLRSEMSTFVNNNKLRDVFIE